MADYTPTTDWVRIMVGYAKEHAKDRTLSTVAAREEGYEWFDRWLAQHVAELRAEVERLKRMVDEYRNDAVDLRTGIEALATEGEAWGRGVAVELSKRLRDLLAGSGEQPGEATIPEACDGGADPTLNHEQHPWPCGDATALRPAPVVPDSTDVLRRKIERAIEQNEVHGLTEQVDAVLAVVEQGVTADCNCGFGASTTPANPRCRANRADAEERGER